MPATLGFSSFECNCAAFSQIRERPFSLVTSHRLYNKLKEPVSEALDFSSDFKVFSPNAMFSFSKDALGAIGQGTVKKSKMTQETIDSVSPQTQHDESVKIFAEAATSAGSEFKIGSCVDDVVPSKDDDIFIVTNALAIPLAVKYASKESARVLFVESNEARVRSAVASFAKVDSTIDVSTGIAFEFDGPRKVTVVSAIVLAGLLSKRKNLSPFTHVVVNNVTSFTVGIQVLLAQLRRVINNQGSKGHHRVMLCGDVQLGLDMIRPAFNKLKVNGLAATGQCNLISIDAVAAFTKTSIVKIPTANSHIPFAPFTAFAVEQVKGLLLWASKSVKAEGAVVVISNGSLSLENAALPIVAIEKASVTKGLFVVIASCAEEVFSNGVTPVAVIDLGISTVLSADSHAESLLQEPRLEFSSVVEMSQRRALAGSRPYFALYPSSVSRPLRSFDAVLSREERNELLQATRSGLDLRAFVAPIRESALDEALTAFSELGLIQSKAEPIQTFLGEFVARLTNLSAEMGTFVAIATALGLGDVSAAVAAASTVSFYRDSAQTKELRARYDPDDSFSSDVLADGAVLLAESEHSSLDTIGIASALRVQSAILQTIANYQPPSDKRSLSEQRAALSKSAALLAFLLTSAFSTSACRISARHGEFLNIRSTAKVTSPVDGSVISFPMSNAVAVATSLRRSGGVPLFDGVTLVSTNHFNAAQVLLRPVVQYSPVSDTNNKGESIVRFAVASNGLTNNYHVPVDFANQIIEARASICTALGLLMLRRLTTPHATSAEEYVSAIRRKRRDFNFVKHIEETARRLEIAVQESPVEFVISTFVKKQASVLSPTEVGVLPEGAPSAIASDVESLEGFFDKALTKVARATDVVAEVAIADAPVSEDCIAVDADDDCDYFAKHGPIIDDDDE